MMKKEQFEVIEIMNERVRNVMNDTDNIRDWTKKINRHTDVSALFSGTSLLVLIVIMITGFVINSSLSELNDNLNPEIKEPEKEPDSFIDLSEFYSGKVQLVGTNSIIVHNVLYEGVCDRDLVKLRVGQKVVIERTNGFITCDRYRVTVQ